MSLPRKVKTKLESGQDPSFADYFIDYLNETLLFWTGLTFFGASVFGNIAIRKLEIEDGNQLLMRVIAGFAFFVLGFVVFYGLIKPLVIKHRSK